MEKKRFSVDVQITKTVEIDDDSTIEIGDLIHEEAMIECGMFNRHEDDFEVMSHRAL
mgnify:CR=1 FL=1